MVVLGVKEDDVEGYILQRTALETEKSDVTAGGLMILAMSITPRHT